MDFIEELRWRHMLHDLTPGLEAHLRGGGRTGYIGFDPTAPSLTIGNYVQVMILTLFQRAGHKPIVLLGGATGRIGDPSGKDKERELKTEEELEANLARQKKQFYKLLNFEEGPNRAIMRNNIDFYKDMNVLRFLREVGKTLTINYMLSKESVAKRLETGMSFTEFSYQLLQAYDFQRLFLEEGCTVQMGGSDQWGNITSGTEFIRRNLGQKAYAITTPLLTKADGSKFGKSEQGNIWLDPELTSPYQFYQFWLRASDADLPRFIRYFTLKSRTEVEAMERDLADDPQALKRLLAEELTIRIHSREAYESVLRVSELLFNRKADEAFLRTLTREDLRAVAREIPSAEVPVDLFRDGGVPIIELLTDLTDFSKSRGETRRMIQNNAVRINKVRVTQLEQVIGPEQLLHDRYLLVELGKKNKYIVIAR